MSVRWLAAPLGLLATVLPAQAIPLKFAVDAPERDCPYAVVTPTPAAARPCGQGWVRVELTNPDRVPHRIGLHLRSSSSRAPFSARRTVDLDPEEVAAIDLPLPRLDVQYHYLDATVDGHFNERVTAVNAEFEAVFSALLVTDRAREWADLQPALDAELRSYLDERAKKRRAGAGPGKADVVHLVVREAPELPERWPLLSGFDLVVLDGRAGGLRPEVLDVLRRYAAAGGNLLVTARDRLPRGPFATLCEGSDAHRHRSSRLRAGRLLALKDDWKERTVQRWLAGDDGVFTAVGRYCSGPAPDRFHARLDIPGLGEPPVRAFFVILLAFAVLGGPVNFLFLRRRRRMLALVTLPGLGFGFTAVVLLIGLFSEGFGIRGSLFAVTIHDQRAKEATVLADRTMYAGLSPSGLRTGPETHLSSLQLQHRSWSDPMTHSLDVDLDRGVVAGSALPSRFPTTLATVSVTTLRERVRFRREGDGLLPSASPALLPRPGSPMVVRDHSGRWYFGEPGRALLPVRPGEVEEHLEEIRTARASDLTATTGHRRVSGPLHALGYAVWTTDEDRLDDHLRRWVPDDLPPGSYVMWTEGPAGLDDLGLDVDWERRHHLVVGRLAEEDIHG